MSGRQRNKMTENLDLQIPKSKGEVSKSAFSFLFAEAYRYSMRKSQRVNEVEERLHKLGYDVGVRLYHVTCWREKMPRRETKPVQFLMLMTSTIWKSIFGRQADQLEKSTDKDNEFMIVDSAPLEWAGFSPKSPRDIGANPASFTAGIVEACLEAAGMPAKVSAHIVNEDTPWRTTFLISFHPSVVMRG
eukprot:TRINITY_DN27629_c0_g1_i1.p1 TRINITY_DN27629_c0_g1~~TRINITY_DN27629_c0_g1_i1.p1  ORF type:complete len:189 (+),score=16.32 TRINITY_DN27629_c0_g1_i1:75-641(+)